MKVLLELAMVIGGTGRRLLHCRTCPFVLFLVKPNNTI